MPDPELKLKQYEDLIDGDGGRDTCTRCKELPLRFPKKAVGYRIDLINPGDKDWFVSNYSFDYHPGSGHIGLSTYSQRSLDASIMIVSQDWGMACEYPKAWSRDVNELVPGEFRGYGLGETSNEYSNNPYLYNLNRYLHYVFHGNFPTGEEPCKVSLRTVRYNELFMTNCVLCLKQPFRAEKIANELKCNSGYFNHEWVTKCSHHLRKTIELVDPKIIIPTGEWPFKAMFYALLPENEYDGGKLKEIMNARLYKLLLQYYGAVELTDEDLSEESRKIVGKLRGLDRVFPTYHCGRNGTNGRYAKHHLELMKKELKKKHKVEEEYEKAAWFMKKGPVPPEWGEIKGAVMKKLGENAELTVDQQYFSKLDIGCGKNG